MKVGKELLAHDGTNEIILIHHTRCGMLAFTDDLLKAGLEGDPAAEKVLAQATGRPFTTTGKASSSPVAFHPFRGQIEALDSPRNEKSTERLQWDVRRGMSTILNHPWIPTSGLDASTVRGFIYVPTLGNSRRLLILGRWARLASRMP